MPRAVARCHEQLGATGESGQMQVDDVQFRHTVDSVDRGAPDMELKAVAPPADTPIDSVTITDFLQTKAMQHLNRGHSIFWRSCGRGPA